MRYNIKYLVNNPNNSSNYNVIVKDEIITKLDIYSTYNSSLLV